ncbi:hypothetical protein [Nocardiopsis oceani]
MPRYLNLSELAYVRHRAAELVHRRRPHNAGRVRTYAAAPRTLTEVRPPRSPRPPQVPGPRRPLETAPLQLLQTVLQTALQTIPAGAHRPGVAF